MHDDLLRRMVGIGDGALVGLGAFAEVAGIDAHDLARGVTGEVGAGVAQGVMGGCRGMDSCFAAATL